MFFGASGGWEQWAFANAVERIAEDVTGFDFEIDGARTPIRLGAAQPIALEESGWKDTIRVGANTAVTVVGNFGARADRFPYHCHLLDHECEGDAPADGVAASGTDVQNRLAAMLGGTGENPPTGEPYCRRWFPRRADRLRKRAGAPATVTGRRCFVDLAGLESVIRPVG